MAQAYGDIVELAGGATYDGSAEYRSQAAAAMAAALEQYRISYSLDATSPLARSSRAESWRLAADLMPGTTHFYCIYD
jgi:hypothetical protein